MSGKQHPVWEEELMPYVDGQLNAGHASDIEKHLEECQDCAAVVGDARGLSQQMATWKVENSSEKMGERIAAELQLDRRNRRPSRMSWNRNRVWALGLSGALAALILVALVTPLLLRSREPASAVLIKAPVAHVGPSPPQGQESPQNQFQLEQDASKQISTEAPSGPMVIRTARLSILTKEFESARSRIQAVVQQSQGYLDQLTVRGETGSGKALSATLRLPSDRIESGLTELRKLGRVLEESQNSSDVTSQYVDLQARLTNARNTEQRLLALQRERTDKLADVVSVEREIARVREEIERMEAQRKDVFNKTQFATIQVELSEEYRAAIEPSTPSAGTQLRNAMIDGYHTALESLLALALFVLRYGPALLLWSVVLVPIALLLRRRLQGLRLG